MRTAVSSIAALIQLATTAVVMMPAAVVTARMGRVIDLPVRVGTT
jgi:hypothetical protein